MLSIFCHVDKACLNCLGRIPKLILLSIQYNFHMVCRIRTEKNSHRFRSSRAHKTRNAQNFTATYINVIHMQLITTANIICFKDYIADLSSIFRINISDFTPDHQTDNRIGVCILIIHGFDMLPITNYSNAISNLLKFFQTMRNIDDSYAILFQLMNNSKQVYNFIFCQRRCWFIKDNDFASLRNHLCNFNHLLFCNRKILHGCSRIHIQFYSLSQNTLSLSIRPPIIYHTVLIFDTSQENIVCNVQMRAYIQLLEYNPDSFRNCICLVLDQNLRPVQVDTSLIGLMHPIQSFYQRRFSSSIFPYQRMNLSSTNIYGKFIQRYYSGKTFSYLLHLKHRYHDVSPSLQKSRSPLASVDYPRFDGFSGSF